MPDPIEIKLNQHHVRSRDLLLPAQTLVAIAIAVVDADVDVVVVVVASFMRTETSEQAKLYTHTQEHSRHFKAIWVACNLHLFPRKSANDKSGHNNSLWQAG